MPRRDDPGVFGKLARWVGIGGGAAKPAAVGALIPTGFAESEIDADGEGGKGRHLLRELTERRRRNDLVRKREFDQLRRLRRMAAVSSQPPQEDTGVDSETGGSSFQDTAIDNGSEERAMTLRKIDEIEEQMSRQWWKARPADGADRGRDGPGSRPPASSAPASAGTPATPAASMPAPGAPSAAGLPPATGRTPVHRPPASVFESTALQGEASRFATTGRTWAPPSSLSRPLDPTEMPLSVGGPPPQREAVVPAPAQLLVPDLELSDLELPDPARPDEDLHRDPSVSRLVDAGPGPWPGPQPALPGFVHDPLLEEAAIEFANADTAGAQGSLRALIDAASHQTAVEPAAHREYWHTLFDLYRALGQREAFETSAIAYAERFGLSPPAWVSLAAAAAPPPAGTADSYWRAPLQVGAEAVLHLQRGTAAASGAWWLDWSGLEGFDYDAVAPLLDLFGAWADLPAHLYFEGAERLLATLEARTLTGAADAEADWWRLRMETLRLLRRMDDYEQAALDYCITYEVSPPSWQAPLCDCRALPIGSHQAAVSDPMRHGADVGLTAGIAATPGSAVLAGEVGSDVATVLAHLDAAVAAQKQQAAAGREDLLVVDCTRLVRLDFVAAGSVLGWAATRHSEGLAIEFRHLHRLVGIFFNVTGISDYARVYLRID
ncbi:hypothetical protein GN316_14150 [Xylophilus sp. Kf1]|nr:hypothetical protein [Xylophilus sp. Kf1]